MKDAIIRYHKLILDFQRINVVKTKTTIMDVSGYPHYENVASRILAFYLDPKGEHGIGDLLLRSFLRLIGIESACSNTKVNIHLEHPTAKGNRIDLVIQGEDFIVGIENKIFHWLANDLEDYSNTLNSIRPESADESKVGRVLLSPNPVTGKNLFGFKSITYPMLWEEVRKHMGEYIGSADNKWLTYLIDFMETTENFSPKGTELNESDRFVLANYAQVKDLIETYNGLLNKLHRRVDQLKAIVDTKLSDTPEYKRFLCPKGLWIYERDCLVVENIFDANIKVVFDLYLEAKGWSLDFFIRNERKAEDVLFFGRVRNAMGIKESGRLLKEWPLETDLETIANYLLDVNKRLVAAATIA